MSTTVPWLDVRLKSEPVIVTKSDPLLYPSEGLIPVIVGLAVTVLARVTIRKIPARHVKERI